MEYLEQLINDIEQTENDYDCDYIEDIDFNDDDETLE